MKSRKRILDMENSNIITAEAEMAIYKK